MQSATADINNKNAAAEVLDLTVIRCPERRPDRPEDAAGKSTMWGGVAKERQLCCQAHTASHRTNRT